MKMHYYKVTNVSDISKVGKVIFLSIIDKFTNVSSHHYFQTLFIISVD